MKEGKLYFLIVFSIFFFLLNTCLLWHETTVVAGAQGRVRASMQGRSKRRNAASRRQPLRFVWNTNLESINLRTEVPSDYIVRMSRNFTQSLVVNIETAQVSEHFLFILFLYQDLTGSLVSRSAWPCNLGLLSWDQTSLSSSFPSDDCSTSSFLMFLSHAWGFGLFLLHLIVRSYLQPHKSHPTSSYFQGSVGIFEFQTNMWVYKHSIVHTGS